MYFGEGNKFGGKERTCVVFISEQLKQGQLQGIYQNLKKKYRVLEKFKQQIENPKKRKKVTRRNIENRLKKQEEQMLMRKIWIISWRNSRGLGSLATLRRRAGM
jgi:hypothetical protein